MASTKLTDCVPELAEAYILGKASYETEHPGYTVIVTCTKRTVSEQQALYAQGRTKPGSKVTEIDGTTTLSHHNIEPLAKALDFAIVFHGKIVWNDAGAFATAASYFKQHGVRWGGDWTHFKDLPHIEVD